MLLRAPAGWPTPVVAVVAMLLLAVVDLAAAYVTKEAVVRRSPPWGVGGAALFVLLFYVYASSLQYAELALVTLGWVVALQVGVLLLDHFRYGNVLSADKWVAVAVILAAQAYLLLAPGEPAAQSAARSQVGSQAGAAAVSAPR
jgi:multidrug transporter EmrE-like cation transporter